MEQSRDAVDNGLHSGGAFSAVIPLVALFYGGGLRLDIEDPTRRGQDMFTLSKGHAVAALASIYADLGLLRLERAEELALLREHSQRPSRAGAAGRADCDRSHGPGHRRGAGICDCRPHRAAFRFLLHDGRRRTAGRLGVGGGDVRRAEPSGQLLRAGGPQSRPTRHPHQDGVPHAGSCRGVPRLRLGSGGCGRHRNTTQFWRRWSASGWARATASLRPSFATRPRATERSPTSSTSTK